MLLKIYWTAWAFTCASAMLLFATGNFTMMAAVVFGFISFGLTFMGMISVLPATLAHPAPVKEVPAMRLAEVKVGPTPAKTFGVLKSA